MSTVWFNTPPNYNGGGPSVWVARMAGELKKRGHKVILDNPAKADVAMCVINVGKTIRKINRSKTRIVLRANGIYNDEYNKLFNRAIRPDMTALHNDLRANIPLVDHVVYQSEFSRDRIFDEIVKYDKNYSVIHNAADPSLFNKVERTPDGFINLFTLGKLRDAYLMESLIGTYQEVKRRGHKVRLVLAGNMDGACAKVYAKHSEDTNILKLGPAKNTGISKLFAHADIFLAPRMGSSNDQVVVEAMMHGIPPVVSEWGGNRELVVSGKSGVVASSGHWDYGNSYNLNLADGVDEVIKNINEFKLQARKHAVEKLGIKDMTDKYIKAMGL